MNKPKPVVLPMSTDNATKDKEQLKGLILKLKRPMQRLFAEGDSTCYLDHSKSHSQNHRSGRNRRSKSLQSSTHSRSRHSQKTSPSISAINRRISTKMQDITLSSHAQSWMLSLKASRNHIHDRSKNSTLFSQTQIFLTMKM
jgi:hypothetical protein